MLQIVNIKTDAIVRVLHCVETILIILFDFQISQESNAVKIIKLKFRKVAIKFLN